MATARPAVDADGWAYTITLEPPILHRVGTDGSVAWSVPLDEELDLRYTLSSDVIFEDV